MALGAGVAPARESRTPHFDDGAVHIVSTAPLALQFGVYAEIVEPGRIASGDPVSLAS